MQSIARGLFLSLIWAVFAAAPAQAQIQGIRPEVHLGVAFHADIDLGARIDIPIVPQGFIAAANDELALSPGIDFLLDDKHSWVGVPVALQWNFYLEPEWSVFPELGLALLFGKGGLGADLLIAVGGRYHLNERNALMLRVGWPFGLQFGVTF